MVDIFAKEKRSWIMSWVHQQNTVPELKVRSCLHRLGYRFRIHRKALPGKPDIVLPKYQRIIFVHGCFWHGHKGCERSKRPSTNIGFWQSKLDRNMKRDQITLNKLQQIGWNVLIVWGCEIRNPEILINKLENFLYE